MVVIMVELSENRVALETAVHFVMAFACGYGIPVA